MCIANVTYYEKMEVRNPLRLYAVGTTHQQVGKYLASFVNSKRNCMFEKAELSARS